MQNECLKLILIPLSCLMVTNKQIKEKKNLEVLNYSNRSQG